MIDQNAICIINDNVDIWQVDKETPSSTQQALKPQQQFPQTETTEVEDDFEFYIDTTD